jgi:hypothetical protein
MRSFILAAAQSYEENRKKRIKAELKASKPEDVDFF